MLNRQNLLDLLSLAVTSLVPGEHYGLSLADLTASGTKEDEEGVQDNNTTTTTTADAADSYNLIAEFTANPDGGASVTSIGPFREALFGGTTSTSGTTKKPRSRLVITKASKREAGGGLELGPLVQVQGPSPQQQPNHRLTRHMRRSANRRHGARKLRGG